MRLRTRPLLLLLGTGLLNGCGGAAPAPSRAPAPPPAAPVTFPSGPSGAPILTPEQALRTFQLPEGYRVEVVAAEPLVQDPVMIDFDADGRMYAVEMRSYMPNRRGEGELTPIGRIVVLEDLNDDGRMDRSTVFLDSLILPRAIKVLEHGVLVGEPPNLWLARDTNGDLRADVKERVRDDFGTLTANPEHNANGFVWGIDNWLHTADWPGEIRIRDGKFEFRTLPLVGQWGVGMDEYGRLYRNFNEDPLAVDLIPVQYGARNPNLPALMRGIYERTTRNVPVWPIHKTPGVNRGYRPQTLRPDSTLAHYTAAGFPTPFVGDRLPAELRRSVFIAEPAGNLVGQFVVRENEDGTLSATRAEERRDFMASTDERFRPVALSSAPDGTLYVVDMYRGIIQHRLFITGFLEQQIQERGLENPTGLGRIYRIVHESMEPGERPRLKGQTPAQLVRHLSHPNGWWRITAQRLLVERGDPSVAPALRRLARTAKDDRFRMHALWTLEGLGQIDVATLEEALEDPSPHVRVAAIRIAEAWLPTPGNPFTTPVMRKMDDPSPIVRRQLAGTLGALPMAEREATMATIATRWGTDPIIADLVVSALPGRELPFLERLLAATGAEPTATVQSLAAAVGRSRNGGNVQRVLQWAGETSRPRWQRLALLSGAATGAQAGSSGPRVQLPAPPAAVLALTESPDTAIGARARSLAASLEWPGKPQPVREVRPLTAAEQQRFEAGREVYANVCAGCHMPTGAGMAGVAKTLVGSPRVNGSAANIIRIVLHGKEGELGLMPPAGNTLSDEQVAAVLTYVRRAWGNEGTPVAPAEVYEARGATLGRTRPWTDAELP